MIFGRFVLGRGFAVAENGGQIILREQFPLPHQPHHSGVQTHHANASGAQALFCFMQRYLPSTLRSRHSRIK